MNVEQMDRKESKYNRKKYCWYLKKTISIILKKKKKENELLPAAFSLCFRQVEAEGCFLNLIITAGEK